MFSPHDLRYADICGNGISGNAAFYHELSNNPERERQLQNEINAALARRQEEHLQLLNQTDLVHPQQQQQQPPEQQQQPQVETPFSYLSSANNRPNNPSYSSFQKRLQSFDSPRWPKNCPVSPNDLAEAGFFYYGKFIFLPCIGNVNLTRYIVTRLTHFFFSLSLFQLTIGNFAGYLDAVECFFCGKGLCRWEPGDDAWSEHKRISPGCPFILDFNRNRREENKHEVANGQSSSSQTSTVYSDDEGYSSQPSSDQQSPVTSHCCSPSTSPPRTLNLNSSGWLSNQPSSNSNCEGCVNRLTCKVCLQEELGVLFLPCGHLVSCTKCAVNMVKCPLCREQIVSTIKAYF